MYTPIQGEQRITVTEKKISTKANDINLLIFVDINFSTTGFKRNYAHVDFRVTQSKCYFAHIDFSSKATFTVIIKIVIITIYSLIKLILLILLSKTHSKEIKKEANFEYSEKKNVNSRMPLYERHNNS